MHAGRLDRRLQFAERREVDDGMGNTVAEYVPQYECAANIKRLRGGESVLAARLEAKQPVVVTVRACTAARAITHDWRATDLRDGTIYAVKENPRYPTDKSGREDRGHLEFLAMSGVVE